jgi:hypothetical protein
MEIELEALEVLTSEQPLTGYGPCTMGSECFYTAH